MIRVRQMKPDATLEIPAFRFGVGKSWRLCFSKPPCRRKTKDCAAVGLRRKAAGASQSPITPLKEPPLVDISAELSRHGRRRRPHRSPVGRAACRRQRALLRSERRRAGRREQRPHSGRDRCPRWPPGAARHRRGQGRRAGDHHRIRVDDLQSLRRLPQGRLAGAEGEIRRHRQGEVRPARVPARPSRARRLHARPLRRSRQARRGRRPAVRPSGRLGLWRQSASQAQGRR